jgi:hypothetical protein
MINQTFVNVNDMHLYIKVPGHLWYTATHYTHVPSTEPEYPYYNDESRYGWMDVVYLTDPIIDPTGVMRSPEWIYVLVNKSMPGMVKIGLTTTSVDQRVKEINGAIGVPTPWIDVFKFKCYGSKYLEREVHQYLAAYRVASNREMFAVTTMHAQEVIEKLGDPYTSFLYVDQKNLEIDLEN